MTDPRIAKFQQCYTSVIHDVMRAKNLQDFTLPPRIQPLQPEGVLCGPAFTIEGEFGDFDPHETLLAWTGLLSECPEGHIWTAQPHTHAIAQMGELSAETLSKKGVLGCVIDGAIRDANFILELGFPSWRTHHTPQDVVGVWMPHRTQVMITIDNVTIRSGDWLHGDRDGMVVIPQAQLDEILNASQDAMKTESKVREAILRGVDPQEAYIQFGKF